jgi:hypothetical protein
MKRKKHRHTWRIERDKLEGTNDWGLSVCDGDKTVCDLYVHMGSCFVRFYKDEVNARLIAAAPAMHSYIVKKAEQGDDEAARMLALIAA